jgi:hypothetical protein
MKPKRIKWLEKLKITYRADNIFGKATKRVLKSDGSDVADHNDNYLEDVKKEFIKNFNKEYKSEWYKWY